jgi:hypothetical protein
MAITINGTTGIDLGGTTRGTVDASWTTAGRPATPSTGQFGFNTTLSAIEFYNGTSWISTNTSNLSYTASYLVVAGGGGGSSSPGAYCAAGGGAGGFLTGTTSLSVGTVYTAVVGGGRSYCTWRF